MTFPLEDIPDFVEETRQSISALAQGHNDLKETIEDALAVQEILMGAAKTQLATARLLQTIVERQVSEPTTNEPDN